MSNSNSSPRAGRMVQQPNGYRAFIPNPLPPVPAIDLTGNVQALLSQADHALGLLEGAALLLPNPELFVFMYIRKEAVLSSQIEGTQSSLQDVLSAEAKLFDPNAPSDVGEVVNYVRAMQHGIARLDQLPISVRLIREIHAELMQGARGGNLTPGELRRSQNWIGPAGCGIRNASFVPPPPHEMLQAMSELELFLNSPSSLPLLVQIAIAHVQFETIHPFLDGNGRVGRLLITFLLMNRGLLTQPVLYLSHHFKRHRSAYYEHLQTVRTRGDWEGWVEFFLQGVIDVSREAALTAKSILAMREEYRSKIADTMGRGAGSAHRVMEKLFDQPIVAVATVREWLDITPAGANSVVNRLVEIGLLSEITGYARNRRFRFDPYLKLFEDGAEMGEI
jgi:Fic family protein